MSIRFNYPIDPGFIEVTGDKFTPLPGTPFDCKIKTRVNSEKVHKKLSFQ
jgi:hypothetical protein